MKDKIAAVMSNLEIRSALAAKKKSGVRELDNHRAPQPASNLRERREYYADDQKSIKMEQKNATRIH
jgi:predicted DNA repair protein MutK